MLRNFFYKKDRNSIIKFFTLKKNLTNTSQPSALSTFFMFYFKLLKNTF